MTGDADHGTRTDHAAEEELAATDRYAAVDIDDGETIIYDRRVQEAWIQSDAAEGLDDWR